MQLPRVDSTIHLVAADTVKMIDRISQIIPIERWRCLENQFEGLEKKML
jgi:hypothetical protein